MASELRFLILNERRNPMDMHLGHVVRQMLQCSAPCIVGMPTRPKRPCGHPGCAALVDKGYCPEHRTAQRRHDDSNRGTSAQRGYGGRWQRISKIYRGKNPLCVMCLAKGYTQEVEAVDHIIPKRLDSVDFWDEDNWQSLCKRCHDLKTARGE
ncbi:hypothetical protein LCGC14_1996070 [marine sediment metagenome]|uniref:HNH nuclease domain-containing protein n=1 Tax=marine sediment metagenome TaxID=412755 RepID=A0A0F9F4H7_9ZZZZ